MWAIWELIVATGFEWFLEVQKSPNLVTRVSIVSKPLRKWGRFVARYGGLVVASSLTLEVDDSSSNPDDR